MTKMSHILRGGYDKGGVTTKAFTVYTNIFNFPKEEPDFFVFYPSLV